MILQTVHRPRSGEHSGRQPSDARSYGRRPFSPRYNEHFDIRHDYLPADDRYHDTRSSGRPACMQCFSEHFRIRGAGRPATNVHLWWREGDDPAVSRPPPGTARAVRPSSRIFRRAPIETPVPPT
jgi:hypothetical protein